MTHAGAPTVFVMDGDSAVSASIQVLLKNVEDDETDFERRHPKLVSRPYS